MKKYIFSYGSLMNPKSREKTLPGKRATKNAVLVGYRRKINAPVNGYLYLNLVPCKRARIEGVLIPINLKDFKKLKTREPGYKCVDVTKNLKIKTVGRIFTFIASDKSYPSMKIPRSYIKTCLSGVQKVKQKKWLSQTIIKNDILEDLNSPVYQNSAED